MMNSSPLQQLYEDLTAKMDRLYAKSVFTAADAEEALTLFRKLKDLDALMTDQAKGTKH